MAIHVLFLLWLAPTRVRPYGRRDNFLCPLKTSSPKKFGAEQMGNCRRSCKTPRSNFLRLVLSGASPIRPSPTSQFREKRGDRADQRGNSEEDRGIHWSRSCHQKKEKTNKVVRARRRRKCQRHCTALPSESGDMWELGCGQRSEARGRDYSRSISGPQK